MATAKKDVLGDFATKKVAESDARMKKMNPKGRKLDKNGNPVVTKEELDKSGMSLRDFLNKERGLTARKGTPKKAAPMTTPYTGPEGNAGDAEAAKNSPMPRIRAEARMKDIVRGQAEQERMDADPLGAGMKKGGKVKGMHRMPDGKMMKDSAHKKQGGKVAKYSRGGGIAVKGLGKGRMC
jgi:hypothetical protein